MDLVLNVGPVDFHWVAEIKPSNPKVAPTTHQMFLAGIQSRAMYTSPRMHGVCLPGIFIADDGKQWSSIGMTYRLIDHPDVTIWLQDEGAYQEPRSIDPKRMTVEYKTNFFWSQRYQDRKSVKLLRKGTYPITFDGRQALASNVELTRLDNSVDFGFLVVSQGDPVGSKDIPNLMLYVIRDAQAARLRGVKPIGKNEFYELAEMVSQTVKHRPVN